LGGMKCKPTSSLFLSKHYLEKNEYNQYKML